MDAAELEARLAELEAETDVLRDTVMFAFQLMRGDERSRDSRRELASFLALKIAFSKNDPKCTPALRPYSYRELVRVEGLLEALGFSGRMPPPD
jgi:hypothetical protein